MLEDGDSEQQQQTREVLRGRGPFRHYMAEDINERPFTRPPHTIVWVPGDGSVVAHSSFEDAQRMARNYAGAHPGEVMAVYQLVGFAHVERVPAPFTPSVDEPPTIEHAARFKKISFPICAHLECTPECDPENAHCARIVQAMDDYNARLG